MNLRRILTIIDHFVDSITVLFATVLILRYCHTQSKVAQPPGVLVLSCSCMWHVVVSRVHAWGGGGGGGSIRTNNWTPWDGRTGWLGRQVGVSDRPNQGLSGGGCTLVCTREAQYRYRKQFVLLQVEISSWILKPSRDKTKSYAVGAY